MNARIDGDGNLHKQHKGEWIYQRCPYTPWTEDGPIPCSYHCPHFHEWEDSNKEKYVDLTCGQRHVSFVVTEDERESSEDKL